MKLLMMLFLSCSFGCAVVPRPDTDILGINADLSHLRGYNLKRDYDDDGNRKPDAKPIVRPISGLADINKYMCTDPKGYEHLITYGKNLREEYMACVAEKHRLEDLCTPSK
jgi:hypothetical protein